MMAFLEAPSGCCDVDSLSTHNPCLSSLACVRIERDLQALLSMGPGSARLTDMVQSQHSGGETRGIIIRTGSCISMSNFHPWCLH